MGLVKTGVGVAITLVIGGTVYTVNKADVVNNFANDTGLTQQQAEKYVDNVKEEDLVSYDKLGNDYIDDGNEILSSLVSIDCVNYTYPWESATLSCELGKTQLKKLGNDEILLGRSYITLSKDTATKTDISTTVRYLGDVNSDLDFEIVTKLLDNAAVTESKRTNSYNKATLQAALESN